MDRRVPVVASFALLVSVRMASAQGPLVAVGGGGTTGEIVARALELAGGRAAIVAVMPQASASDDAGEDSAEMWRTACAKDVRVITLANRAAARSALEAATLIWIPGGDQNRFMKTIAGTGLDDVIRTRHAAGVAVGGTSAGAAVLSKVSIDARGAAVATKDGKKPVAAQDVKVTVAREGMTITIR